MWLSGQHKRPAESGEGQTGIITMSGIETAALLDCERRGLQIYSPAGYRWTPKVGQRVLVIQGKGEIPCVVGARQDGGVPEAVSIEAGTVGIEAGTLSAAGNSVNITAGGTATVHGGSVRLEGQVYVNDETLEELIIRIVLMILGGR